VRFGEHRFPADQRPPRDLGPLGAHRPIRQLPQLHATWGLPAPVDPFVNFPNPIPPGPVAPLTPDIPLSTDVEYDPSAAPGDPSLG